MLKSIDDSLLDHILQIYLTNTRLKHWAGLHDVIGENKKSIEVGCCYWYPYYYS